MDCNCPKCQSIDTVKNGLRTGKQCFLCRECGRQFIAGDNAEAERDKCAALTLCAFGLSMRKIGYLLGYSHVTILNWAREFEKKDLPREDYFMELDELCDFLKTRTANPKMGKRFPTMQEAITWNVEKLLGKQMDEIIRTRYTKV